MTADITAKELTVTGVTASNKAYDGGKAATLDTSSAALVGVVGSEDVTLDASNASGEFAQAGVGTGIAVTVSGLTFTGDDKGNYTLEQPDYVTADITALVLTVTGASADNKPYDGGRSTNDILYITTAQ